MFLDVVQPSFVFICVGRDNTFNHPHPIVINRLNNMNIDIYATSDYGSIKYDFRKSKISFTN